MQRFEQKTHFVEPLAPFIKPSERVYERTLKRMNMFSDEVVDYIRSYDEAAEKMLSRFNAPLLQYIMVPESMTAFLQQLITLQHGPIRNPLILGYTADRNGTTYAMVLTCKRGSGDGEGDVLWTFIRKRNRKYLEGYNPRTDVWDEMPDSAMIYNLTQNGPAGRELVNGLCEFFDTDIFHLNAGDVSRIVNEYGNLLNLCDMLHGAGKIQMMVLETIGYGKPESDEVNNRYFPVLVANNSRMQGCAVAMCGGKFCLLQYREAFRFSKNMTIIWGDSLIGNEEFSHTVYTTEKKEDLIQILQIMWTKEPKDGYYRIFPASNKAFAEINGTNVRISSFRNGGQITAEEQHNIDIGLHLLQREKTVQDNPKN